MLDVFRDEWDWIIPDTREFLKHIHGINTVGYSAGFGTFDGHGWGFGFHNMFNHLVQHRESYPLSGDGWGSSDFGQRWNQGCLEFGW